ARIRTAYLFLNLAAIAYISLTLEVFLPSEPTFGKGVMHRLYGFNTEPTRDTLT
ncbi:MAG: hypothetical protein K0Q67_2880, partial [Cellvibrio sp.]|nr:hypothetical protein [Cellvibrio sp.]